MSVGGKVVVITGGSRGLGLEMSTAFAREGATVVVASRKLEACREVADQLIAAGGRADAVRCHVGDWEDCNRLAATVHERHGRIDVLINNAGMSPTYGALSEVSEALWDKVLDVNLRGPWRLSALAGEQMADADGGTIINISSIAAVQPGSHELPYAAAKAGLNVLTVGLARAFAPKVRVNAIMAGPFLTEVSKAWDPEAFAETARTKIPLRRAGEPHEVVGAALYLAGSASSYTTGAVLKIDGGTAWAPA